MRMLLTRTAYTASVAGWLGVISVITTAYMRIWELSQGAIWEWLHVCENYKGAKRLFQPSEYLASSPDSSLKT